MTRPHYLGLQRGDVLSRWYGRHSRRGIAVLVLAMIVGAWL